MDQVDHVVSVCEWARTLLLANDVPSSKISVSRHGLPRAALVPRLDRTESHSRSPLRILYLGRLDPAKGAHLLIRAIRMRENLPVTLEVCGIAQGEAGDVYLAKLRQLAGADIRITFNASLKAAQAIEHIGRHDILAVPSIGLETGPLVVLEAFAAGVPVLGSRLGGIEELVKDGINGLLVRSLTAEAWAVAIAEIAREPARLERLRRGISPPRSMDDVAGEMQGLYETMSSRGRAHRGKVTHGGV
jgi:glycosyltransferase involved in cell wall biosynthesis